MYRQYLLTSDATVRVTWLDTPVRLRVGTQLTLKKTGDMLWSVTESYDAVTLTAPPDTTWQVGGLTGRRV